MKWNKLFQKKPEEWETQIPASEKEKYLLIARKSNTHASIDKALAEELWLANQEEQNSKIALAAGDKSKHYACRESQGKHLDRAGFLQNLKAEKRRAESTWSVSVIGLVFIMLQVAAPIMEERRRFDFIQKRNCEHQLEIIKEDREKLIRQSERLKEKPIMPPVGFNERNKLNEEWTNFVLSKELFACQDYPEDLKEFETWMNTNYPKFFKNLFGFEITPPQPAR